MISRAKLALVATGVAVGVAVQLSVAGLASAQTDTFTLRLNDGNSAVGSLEVTNSATGSTCFDDPQTGDFPAINSGSIQLIGFSGSGCTEGNGLAGINASFQAAAGDTCIADMTTDSIIVNCN